MLREKVRKIIQILNAQRKPMKKLWQEQSSKLTVNYDNDVFNTVEMKYPDSNEVSALIGDENYNLLISYDSYLGFAEIWISLDREFYTATFRNGERYYMLSSLLKNEKKPFVSVLEFIDATISHDGLYCCTGEFADSIEKLVKEDVINSNSEFSSILCDSLIRDILPEQYRRKPFWARFKKRQTFLQYQEFINPDNFKKILLVESCESYDGYNEAEIVPAQTLPAGWVWHEYDDGSGHLESPEKTRYFSYDMATKEYIDPRDGRNTFMEGYPYGVSFEDFKKFAETYIIDIIRNAEEEKEANKIHQCLYEHGALEADIDEISEALHLALKDDRLIVTDSSDDDDIWWGYLGYEKSEFGSHKYDYYFNCSEDFSRIEYIHIFDAGEGIEETLCRISDKLRLTIIGKCLIYRYDKLNLEECTA